MMQNFGVDSGQSQYVGQYIIAGHLWAALHIHRSHDGQTGGTIQQHTDHAYRILKALLAVPVAESADPLLSKPIVTKTTRTGPSKARAALRSRKPPATPRARKGRWFFAMFYMFVLTWKRVQIQSPSRKTRNWRGCRSNRRSNPRWHMTGSSN